MENRQPQKYNSLIFATCIISIACSIITIISAMPNSDGLLYLKTAEIFQSQGLQAALKSYHWPFYPILIATLSNIFYSTINLDLLNSAYILSIVFQVIIIFSYLKIFNLFNPTKSQFIFAAIAIILFPQLNDYRADILRDFGFWAFSLLAVYNLCYYITTVSTIFKNSNITEASIRSKNHQILNILFYYLNFLIAFLFRAEAVVFMCLFPLGVLFNTLPRNQKYQTLKFIYLPLITLALILAFILLASLISTTLPTPKLAHLSIQEIFNSLFINLHFDKLAIIKNTYSHNISVINNNIFYITPLDNLESFVYFTCASTGLFILNFITILNPIYFIFLILGYRLYNKQLIAIQQQSLISTILFSFVISSLLPLLFLYLIFVTSGRYYIFSSILLIVLIPFAFDYYWQKIIKTSFYTNYNKLSTISITFALVAILISNLSSFGYSKTYIKQAGAWYKKNNLQQSQPHTQQLALSNNAQLNYYAGLKNEPDLTFNLDNIGNNNKYDKYKYLLLKVKYKDNHSFRAINKLEQENKLIILKKFNNKRNDTVYIIEKTSIS